MTKAADFRRKFGSDKNENPNYGREDVDFFPQKKIESWKDLDNYIEGLVLDKE